MEETGDLIHTDHRYVGTFQDNLPYGRGKYIFDHGCEQRGRYEHVEVVLEPEVEDEEAVTEVRPKWLCGEIVSLN